MSLVISDTSYAGTVELNYIITPSIFGLDTVKKGTVMVKDGIKKQFTIPTMDLTSPLRQRVPTPVVGTNVADLVATVGGRVLDPRDVMVYMQFVPDNYAQHFYAEQLSKKLLERELPLTPENYIMELLMGRSLEQIERGFHLGSTTYTASLGTAGNGQIKFFDGFIKKALVAGALQVPGAGAITEANILAKMQEAINLLPVAVKATALIKDTVKFELGVEDYFIFDNATRNLPNKGQNVFDRVTGRIGGFDVIPVAGIPKDTFYLSESMPDVNSNKWVGVNAIEDQYLQLARLQANSEEFFIKGLMQFDTQLARPAEFVIHTTLTIPSFSL